MTSSILAERSERRALGAEHPRDGVDDVGLAAPVGTDDDGDPGLESSTVGSAKDLKPFMLSDLRNIQGDPTGCLQPAWGLNLAVFAEEGRAPARLDPDDGVAATPAGLALAVVDLARALEVAELAEQVAVLLVGQRGSPGA